MRTLKMPPKMPGFHLKAPRTLKKLSLTLGALTALTTPITGEHSFTHPRQAEAADPVSLTVFGLKLAYKIYKATRPEELSQNSRAAIAEVLNRQTERGFVPLSALDSKTREKLGAQGRLELGIEQLHQHLDVWGDKLLRGQGEIKAELERVIDEGRAGHALTQQILNHMLHAKLQTGLVDLNDGLVLLEKDPQSLAAQTMLGKAKSSLVEHIEYLKAEERVGRMTSVEQWAVLRLSLASCYLGLDMKEQAIEQLAELIALPIEGEGLARLRERLPKERDEAQRRYFDERNMTLESRVLGLRFAERRLDEWLEALKEERGRLLSFREAAREMIKLDAQLIAAWGALSQSAESRAQKAEDESALRAFMVLGSEFSRAGITWVMIPAGSFQMGSGSGGSDDERPVRTVTLKAFQMSKTEVTVGQYRRCVVAGVCSEPQWESCYMWNGASWNIAVTPQSLRGENQPVVCVDWGQARTFAKWVGADLPTEAEWEYAARGGQVFTYAGSNNPQDVAIYSENSGGGTQPVKSKQANTYGLHDMSGNVWEWVLDEYKSDYKDAPSDGHKAVGPIPTCKIKCDNGAARRVNRGGGWGNGAGYLRVARRNSLSPDGRSFTLGLRLRRTDPLTP